MERISKIFLGILGFSSLGLFVTFLLLLAVGEPEAANETKNLPNTLNDAKQEAQIESTNAITGAMVDLNEERKELIANEEDPNLKNMINWIFFGIFFYLGITVLAILGIKLK
ncbi:MAG: hypothetical protein WC852_07785 [Candidatus Nanoarchaeia archaeon]|jgi:hypothetical protein